MINIPQEQEREGHKPMRWSFWVMLELAMVVFSMHFFATGEPLRAVYAMLAAIFFLLLKWKFDWDERG
jgi:hypothetical protein